MAKPRPVELHVNSKGAKKHQKLQELIHEEERFLFLPIDGQLKTDLYNKGLLDGRKRAFKLYETYSECSDLETAVIAISREAISTQLTLNNRFTGVIQLDQTFLIDTREANRFIEEFCNECEFVGTPQCFMKIGYDCADEDRDKYRDTPYLMRQQEIRRARRKHTPFPG